MRSICPKCGRCSVEHDPRYDEWKCCVSSCSWSKEEDLTKVRSERSELLNELHMTFDEKLASGLK